MNEIVQRVRDLHTKAPLYNLADDCEVCSSDDEAIQEQHEQVEGSEGDWLCASIVTGHSCRHCSDVHEYGMGDGEPVTWPCATAKIVYAGDELI